MIFGLACDDDPFGSQRDRVAIGGDGQVTSRHPGDEVGDAVKIRKLLDGQVLVGFRRLSGRRVSHCSSGLRESSRTTPTMCRALPPSWPNSWRTDRMLQRLEAVLVVVDLEAQPAP